MVDILVVNLGDIEWSMGTDANVAKLTSCRVLKNGISSQEPKETFGYNTIKVSLNDHLFQQRFLITRTILPILGKDFLEKHTSMIPKGLSTEHPNQN